MSAGWPGRWSRTLALGTLLALLAFAIFGPLANLFLWAFAEKMVFPEQAAAGVRIHVLGARVLAERQRGGLARHERMDRASDRHSQPGRRDPGGLRARPDASLRWRALILLAFLLPQAVPNLPVYVNIARVFYEIGLNGTILGVVLVHAAHGLVLAVWIASAAFASVDVSLEEAARNIGASAWTCFRTVTLPLAAPGLIASAIFVFLESLDEFTGTYFVGVPDVTTLPLLMFNASMGGNYQIASITALLLLHSVDRLHARRRAFSESGRPRHGGAVGSLDPGRRQRARLRAADAGRAFPGSRAEAGRRRRRCYSGSMESSPRPAEAKVAAAWNALARVPDPEIPMISVVELGIVRDVTLENGAPVVTLTTTYSGCPAAEVIARDVERALDEAGLRDARVETRLSPAWTTDWIAPEAKRKLQAFGIAPPAGAAPRIDVAGISPLRHPAAAAVECPRCGSSDTRLLSQFGSTACKAQYRCEACLEPFDYFKPH